MAQYGGGGGGILLLSNRKSHGGHLAYFNMNFTHTNIKPILSSLVSKSDQSDVCVSHGKK